jgi:signal transduction histidine kinase
MVGMIFILMAIAAFFLGWFIVDDEQRILQNQTNKQGASLVDMMATFSVEPLLTQDFPNLEVYAERLAQVKHGVAFVLIEDGEGQVVVQAPRDDVQQLLAEASIQVFEAWVLVGSTDSVPIGKVKIGLLTIEPDQLIASRVLVLGTAALITVVILSLFLSWLIQKMMLEPIAQLDRAAETLGEGDLKSQIVLSGGEEFGRLAVTLNAMRLSLNRSYEEIQNQNERLKELDKMKSEFLANMSHELRTPMHAILSFAALGEKKVDTADKARLKQYFSRIQTSGERLMNLLNNLLDLSKLESGTIELELDKYDLGELAEMAVKDLSVLVRGKSIQFVVVPSDVSLLATFDQAKIFQVILNLLSNAIKFSPEGGVITLSYEVMTQKGAGSEAIAVVMSVADRGVGVPKDESSAVFNKFVQSSKTKTGSGGTGLGLAICKEIITGHGGKIWVDDNPDVGAIFRFSLPY